MSSRQDPAQPPSSPLESFLASLVQAWRKLLLYPETHPARRDAISQPFESLRTLIALTGGFELGVDEQELVVGETSFASLATAELAKALYQRNVAIVTFHQGLQPDELMQFLLLLKPQQTGLAALENEILTPLARELQDQGIEHIQVIPVDYQKALDEELIEDAGFEASRQQPRTLWGRILRAFLGHDEEVDQNAEEAELERVLQILREKLPAEGLEDPSALLADELAKTIDQLATAVAAHLGLAATDNRPRDSGGDSNAHPQVHRLLEALPTAVRIACLEAVVRDGSTSRDRHLLRTLAEVVSTSDLILACRRLRDRGFGFGTADLQALDLLLRSAEPASAEEIQDQQETARQILELLAADVDRLPPDMVDQFLVPIVRAQPITQPKANHGSLDAPAWSTELGSLAPREAEDKLIATLLEMLRSPDLARQPFATDAYETLLQKLESVLREMIEQHAAHEVVEVVESLQQTRAQQRQADQPLLMTAIDDSLERLASEQTVDSLVAALDGALSGDVAPLRDLARALKPSFIGHLVRGMSEIEDRGTRRHLLTFLESLPGPLVAPHAVEHLSDRRWFVVRNMLTLLNQLDDRSALSEVRGLLGHSDQRVQIEALRLLGRLDSELPASALDPLVSTDDPQLLERAVDLFGRFRISSAVEPLLAIATAFDPLGRKRTLRILAVQSLGLIGDPRALEPIQSYFASGVVRHNLEERRAAYRSLAGYPPEARTELVERGLAFRDSEIKAVCEQLASAQSPHESVET